MNRKSLVVLILVGIGTALLTGCDSGAGIGGSSPSIAITAQRSVNGITEAWVSASLNGLMVGPEPCDPTQDPFCVFEFSGVTTNLGTYTLYTDAIPADWNIGATEEAGSSDCPSGASWTGNLTAIQGAQIVCGSFDASSAIVTPSSCIYELNNTTGQVIKNTCTFSTITLSLPSPATLPTAHAMTVGTYDDVGNSVASNSITASSSTSITVPIPNVAGASAIVIVDPATNKVMGTGLFTRTVLVINPCGSAKNCP